MPMEIGNVEKPQYTRNGQRQKYMDRNSCFSCRRVGFRPWKHRDDRKNRVMVNNVGVNKPEMDSSDESNNCSSDPEK